MSIKQIENINQEHKNAIMKSIFLNYNKIKKNVVKTNNEFNKIDYNNLELFALIESIIAMMDPKDSEIIKSYYVDYKNTKDKYKLHNAINKFVFYLFA